MAHSPQVLNSETIRPSSATRMLQTCSPIEMWERYSFYGMQGIMVYYLYTPPTKGGWASTRPRHRRYRRVQQSLYLMTILGGILGDRLLGPKRTLIYSPSASSAGHISSLLIPGFRVW